MPEADTPAAKTAGEGSGSRLDSFPDFDADRKAEDSKEEEKTFKPVHYDLDWGDDTPSKPKTDRVSFDWSSVIDEGHRKKTSNIRSPWDDKGLDEDEYSAPIGDGFRGNTGPEIPEDEREKKDDLEERIARDAAEKPRAKDKSRTLNFIEIMKQEKEAQEREKSGEGSLYRDDTEEGPVLPEDEREKTRGSIDMDDDVVSAIRNDRDDMGELDFDSQLRRIREQGRENSDRVLKHEPPQSFTDEGRAEAAKEEKKKTERREHEKIADELEKASSDDDFLFDLDHEEREELENTEVPENAGEDLFDSIEIPASGEEEKAEEPAFEPAAETEAEEPEAPAETAAAAEAEEIEETEEVEEPGSVDESDYLDYLDYEPRGRASRAGRVQSHEPDESDYEEFGEDVDLGDDEEDEENNDVMAEYEAALGAISGEDAAKAEPAEETAEAEEPAAEASAEPAEEAPAAGAAQAEEAHAAAADNAAEGAAAPAEEETVSSVDSEIADLQKKLAELLKEKDEEPVEIPRRDKLTAEDLTRDENMVFGGEEEEGTEDDDDFLRKLGYTSYDSVIEDGKKEEESPEDIYDGNESKPGIQTGTPSSEIAYGTEEPAGEALDLSAYGIENEPVKKTSDKDATVEMPAQQPETKGAVPENGHEVKDLDSELAALGFDVLDSTGDDTAESDMVFTSESTDVSEAEDSEGNEAMPIDELESDLFGESGEGEDVEATRKIEKFYTLYRKNEEFQKLLDEEYEKLKAGSADYTLMDDVLSEYDGEPSFAEKVDEAEKKSAEIDEKVKDEASEAVKREAEKFADAKTPEPVKEAAEASAAEAIKLETPKAAVPAPETEKVSAEALAKTQNAPEMVADEEPEKGGGLVVAAVIVAVLLLLLLIVILILNFAPDSAIALKLSEMISNFTNFAAADDGTFLM